METALDFRVPLSGRPGLCALNSPAGTAATHGCARVCRSCRSEPSARRPARRAAQYLVNGHVSSAKGGLKLTGYRAYGEVASGERERAVKELQDKGCGGIEGGALGTDCMREVAKLGEENEEKAGGRADMAVRSGI